MLQVAGGPAAALRAAGKAEMGPVLPSRRLFPGDGQTEIMPTGRRSVTEKALTGCPVKALVHSGSNPPGN
jgi:hypothetical protein